MDLEKLLDDPCVEVYDTTDRQLHDLAQLRPAPDPVLQNEPTRWYYYPWRRSVVHLLGPRAFQALRADRNRYKITEADQQRLRENRVGVVGLSVGHVIAYTLALESSCGRIVLADFDELELSNLNRIPGTVFDLGLNKAVVVARRIAELDPYIEVQVEPAGVLIGDADRLMSGLDVIIEECDSFDAKLAVREAARRARIPVIMETSDRGLLDVERFDLEPDRPLFHGLLGTAKPADLVGLSTPDKVPYILRTLEPDKLSAVIAASMTEVDETLSTWPQLASEVTLGAATAVLAVRKIALGAALPSGRVRFDIDEVMSGIAEPVVGDTDDADDGLQETTDPEPAPSDAAEAVVHAARWAPSGGNTQPWWIRRAKTEVQIALDRTKTSTLDVGYRGSFVAIGAALFNARVAAAHHGVLGSTQVFPNGVDAAPVARLTLGTDQPADLAEMYEPMLHRVSNRHLTQHVALPADVAPALRSAAEREGCTAHVLSDPSQLAEVAELFGESDRIRYLTEQLHREMMSELRWPRTDDLDWGIDVRTLELDESDLAKLGVARRVDVMAILADLNLGRALGEPTRDRINGSSAVVVVSLDGSEAADFVRGGQAAERVWIEAERFGLAVQAISPVFIFAIDDGDYRQLSERHADHLCDLRRRFADLAGIGDRPIALVLRMGYAPPISVRSRRLPAHRAVRLL